MECTENQQRLIVGMVNEAHERHRVPRLADRLYSTRNAVLHRILACGYRGRYEGSDYVIEADAYGNRIEKR